MSLHSNHQGPSASMPVAAWLALALETVFAIVRIAAPKGWIGEVYFIVLTGVYVASAALMLMAIGELARRLPEPRAAGARIAMVCSAVFLGLLVASRTIDAVSFKVGQGSPLVWQIQQWIYLALYLGMAVGLWMAAKDSARAMGGVIALVVVSLVMSAPDPFAEKIRTLFGANFRYVFAVLALGQLALQVFLVHEASRASTQALPAEPSRALQLLGTSLRVRVAALFVLVAFTVFAVGGRSLGSMKVAMIGAPLINAAAFLVFSIAALRAGRGLDRNVDLAFGIAGGLAAWCAGVLSAQVPALYEMMSQSGGYASERAERIAQAMSVTLPLLAVTSVVVALVATGTHLRRSGHTDAAATLAPKITTFVILMLGSVLVQVYLLPEARSVGSFVGIGLLAAVAGVGALLVAAGVFQRAAETVETAALPTATLVPPGE